MRDAQLKLQELTSYMTNVSMIICWIHLVSFFLQRYGIHQLYVKASESTRY